MSLKWISLLIGELNLRIESRDSHPQINGSSDAYHLFISTVSPHQMYIVFFTRPSTRPAF